MSLNVLELYCRIQMECNYHEDCQATGEYSGKTEREAEKAAEADGWRMKSSGSSWSPRTDECKAHRKTCPDCKGIKPEPVECEECCCTCHHQPEDCKTCRGQGYVPFGKCRVCHGEGSVTSSGVDMPCRYCGGVGEFK